MALSLVTAPATEPISVADVRAQCRIAGIAEDSILEALIRAARQHLDGPTGILRPARALLTQTWELALDAFPCEPIELMPPVQSVASVTYLDMAGVLRILDPSTYLLDARSEPARLLPAYNAFWPATRCTVNAVIIKFITGCAAAAAVPEPIRLWLRMQVAQWFENRELAAGAVPSADLLRLLTPWRGQMAA